MYDPYKTETSPKIDINFKRNRISSKKAGVGTVNAGGAIIIIIFVVLCLTIFGLLSFATSFADKKLADKNLQSVTNYYRADSEAEEKLAMLYDSLSGYVHAAADIENFFDYDFVSSAVSDSNVTGNISVSSVEKLDNGEIAATVFYTTDMTDMSDSNVKFYLSSEVVFYFNESTKKLTYKITEWRVMMDSTFNYDANQYKLWDFGSDEETTEAE